MPGPDGLTDGLEHLKLSINARFPNRDKTSDGTWGDKAHQEETSGHNPDDTPGSKPEWNGDPDNIPEVRAEDIDSDLRDPDVSAQELVDHVRKLPGIANELRYIIYWEKMYHERDNFEPTPYTGASKHHEHIHFSGAFSQAADNNKTFDYKLNELGVDMVTDADKNDIADATLKRDVIPNATTAGDYKDNPTVSLLTAVHRIYQLVNDLTVKVDKLSQK
jgi:hypothetical protein